MYKNSMMHVQSCCFANCFFDVPVAVAVVVAKAPYSLTPQRRVLLSECQELATTFHGMLNLLNNRVFSHDVTAAILVSQNNETAAILVSQTSPVGVELFSYANTFFCSNKFA